MDNLRKTNMPHFKYYIPLLAQCHGDGLVDAETYLQYAGFLLCCL